MLLELLMGAPPVVVAPPTGFGVTTFSVSRIDLSWTNASAGLQIEVYRNGVLYQTLAAGTTTYQDNGIAAGVEYAYKIRHRSGSNLSVFTVTITRSGVPPAPNLNFASNSFEDEVDLGWVPQAVSQTAVRVYRNGVNVSGNLAADATEFTDLDVPNGSYAYTVRNFNGVAESADSNVANVTVSYSPPLADPSGLTLTSTHSDRVVVAFTSGDVTAQTEVYRGLGPDPTTLLTTLAAGVVSYNDNTVTQGTHYHYRIRHVKGAQLSGYVADEVTVLVTSFTGVSLVADEGTEEIVLTWTLVNPPVSPTVDIGSWSDTAGEATAGGAFGVTSPRTVVTYTNIVPIPTGTTVTGTLTYLLVKNGAGTTLASLTDLTVDFDISEEA